MLFLKNLNVILIIILAKVILGGMTLGGRCDLGRLPVSGAFVIC